MREGQTCADSTSKDGKPPKTQSTPSGRSKICGASTAMTRFRPIAYLRRLRGFGITRKPPQPHIVITIQLRGWMVIFP